MNEVNCSSIRLDVSLIAEQQVCGLRHAPHPEGERDGCRGRLRCANRPYARVATAPDCRYQIAPLTIDLQKGVNRRP